MTIIHLYEGISSDDAAADAGPLTLGTEFLVTADCWITGFRFLKAYDDATTLPRLMGLSAVGPEGYYGGVIVPQIEMPLGPAGGGWVEQSINPVRLTPGRYKAVTHHPEGQYTAISQWFSTGPNANDIVRGPVTVVSNANAALGNGTYFYSSNLDFPDSTYNATAYFADVIISDTDPAQAATRVTFNHYQSGAWVEKTAEAKVFSGGQWVNTDITFY